MLNTDDLRSIDVVSLASLCKSETEKFFRKLANDNRYCFELFCRAYRDLAEDALTHIYTIYLPILYNHAKKHKAFEQSSQEALNFARAALVNFYLAVKGEKFLHMFSSLPQVMGYLNTCISSEIFQDVRKHHREMELGESPVAPSSYSENDLKELLEHIHQVLVDEKDRFLFELRFMLEIKPAEVAERYPEMWSTTREVTVHLYRIRQRLRQNPYLRSLITPD
jgi:hypothetical protein